MSRHFGDYFDSLSRRTSAASCRYPRDREFLQAVVSIEGDLFNDVTAITGDREFPADLREDAFSTLAVKGVYQPGNLVASKAAIVRVLRARDSRAAVELRGLFRNLARRQVVTRFGTLSDDPVAMAKARDEHDAATWDQLGGVGT